MDFNNGLIGLAGAFISKDTLNKVLGPTAEYLGDGLKNFTQKRLENIEKIIANAANKLGKNIENEGTVPPRILKEIFDSGSFADTELTVEYYGGILASSRSSINRDDRAITYLDQIKKLSTYQLRMHYLLYFAIRKLFLGSKFKISTYSNSICAFFPFSYLEAGIDFFPHENADILLHHSFVGLKTHNLIDNFQLGDLDFLKSRANYLFAPRITKPGLICSPSPAGVELFLNAMGISNCVNNDYLSPSLRVNELAGIAILDNAERITAENDFISSNIR